MPAERGDLVSTHYRGTLEDGTEFDSTFEGKPGAMEFRIGEGVVIPGFENAVIGMEPGETRTVTVEPDDAYGDYNKELVRHMKVDDFPRPPSLGIQVEMVSEDGRMRMPGIITDIEGEDVIVDLNHPLAGEILTYEIQLVAIIEKGSLPQ